MDKESSSLGPCNILLTDDDLILYKKNPDSKLCLNTINFSEEICFKNIKSPILSYGMLSCGSQHKLIISTSCARNKLICFTVA